VQAYVERFEYLARFYSQTVTKEWRCRKFEGGLKHKMRQFIVPLRVREFPVLVEQVKSVEQLEMGSTVNSARADLKKIVQRVEHFKRNCMKPMGSGGGSASTRKCYACDQPGHFAMTSTETTQSGSLILDYCLLLDNSELVLFDSRASHSFISHDCVKKLGLSTCDLGCKLIVSTLASGQVSTNFACVGCSMEV